MLFVLNAAHRWTFATNALEEHIAFNDLVTAMMNDDSGKIDWLFESPAYEHWDVILPNWGLIIHL